MNYRSFKTLSFTSYFMISAFFITGQETWSVVLPTIGTFSSPRLTDLNGDGVDDIILGGGRLEFQACDTAMFALDGKDGKLLWKISAIDQIFGSASFLDITNDGIDDIFLNGRSSELKAINGSTSDLIWAFDTLTQKKDGSAKWFNFYNVQFIHDVDGDGYKDILTSNGGDIWVAPYDPNRQKGSLVVLSSKTGKLMADAYMPDAREIYMSVSIDLDTFTPVSSSIIFGTGGETIRGNLYRCTLEMVLKGDLNSSILLDSSLYKGFISPPAWVDINGDGRKDIISACVDGRLMAYDGRSYKKIWQASIPNSEAYSSMGVGYFNEDQTPDFFVSFAQGVWPDLSWTKQAMVDGSSGAILYTDSLGYYQTSSPLAADLNGDGIDEVILSVDYQVIDDLGLKTFFTTLYAIDFVSRESFELLDGVPGHNVSSTPWLGDMDSNGFLDIVFCHATNAKQTYTFDGLRVTCLKTLIPISRQIKWGSYMGSSHDGVFR